MDNVVRLSDAARRSSQLGERAGAIVRPFPGERDRKTVETIAAIIATLGDDAAEEFMVGHFDIECSRLSSQGVSDADIDKFIFTTARAIWLRVRKIGAGVA